MPSIENFLKKNEEYWSQHKNLPHFKYVARPLYRFFGGNKFPLISVPLTFLAMDFLFHQLPARAIDGTLDFLGFEEAIDPSIFIISSLVWLGISMPVAIQKYKNLSKNEENYVADDFTPQAILREIISSGLTGAELSKRFG